MKRQSTLITALLAVATITHTLQASEEWSEAGVLPLAERPTSSFSSDSHRQFDFWIGEWDVNLRTRQADYSWKDSVTARVLVYPILNGKAILELWDSEPIKGYSLRYYDDADKKWQLWLNWPGKNSTNSSTLQGEFRHGRGDFVSRYPNPDGVELIERFSFNDIFPDSLRWDDHVSHDGGDTWRDNWRMEWTRTASSPTWPIEGLDAHTYDDGSRCDAPDFRSHEQLAGRWTGTLRQQDSVRSAEVRAYRVLDGCAVMVFARSAGQEWFWFNFYDTAGQRWSSQYLSDERGVALVPLIGDESTFAFIDSTGAYRQAWSLAGDHLMISASGTTPGDSVVLNVQRESDGIPGKFLGRQIHPAAAPEVHF